MPHLQQNDTLVQPEPTAAANAPHVSQRELISESTPAKKKFGSDIIYASVVQPFDEVRDQLEKEMGGHWLGAMPVDTFFDELVPATKEPLPELPDDPFANVPIDGAESTFYDPFVSSPIIL